MPKLTAELDRTEKKTTLRALGFVLREIGDPRAVPALIRAIPRLYGSSGSDCGIIIPGEPELTKFMKQHDNSAKDKKDKSDVFDWGRPIREVMPALEKITGESHGWLEINFADSDGHGLEQSRVKRTLFLNHALKWADWWSKNWRKFVPNEADAQLEQTRRAVELVAVEIAKIPRRKSLGEIPCGPNVKIGSGANWTRITSFDEYPYHGIMDLDTGRIPIAPKELLKDPPDGQPSAELTAWAEREGADLIIVKISPPGGETPYFALRPLGMKLWRIDNQRYKDLQNDLRYAKKVELPEPWQGDVAQIDEKTGKYGEKVSASYFFITKEGICGAMQFAPITMRTIAPGIPPQPEGGWSYRYIFENGTEK